MGTSRRRTPAGARLNYGAQRRPDRTVCGDQENCQAKKRFKGVAKKFSGLQGGWLTDGFRAARRALTGIGPLLNFREWGSPSNPPRKSTKTVKEAMMIDKNLARLRPSQQHPSLPPPVRDQADRA